MFRCDTFREKLFAAVATQICDRNMGKQISERLLTGYFKGFEVHLQNRDREGEFTSLLKS